jgi:hypothetical protein
VSHIASSSLAARKPDCDLQIGRAVPTRRPAPGYAGSWHVTLSDAVKVRENAR